jgi:pheromone shutdown-related protein TraB
MSSTKIELEDKTILLIGTAHISKESVNEVRRVIEEEKPSLVCVEIDALRYNSMTQNENWEKLDIIKVIKQGNGFLLLGNLVLAGFQRRLGGELGVKPGDEMTEAVAAAKELGVEAAFCDREVQITLRRAWGNCGFISKCKLLAALFSSAFSSEKLDEAQIENLKKNTELDGMMNELSDYLPEVKKTLIDERDIYLASKIWTAGNNKKTTVAIIGAGHLNGVKRHIEEFSKSGKEADVSELETLPKKSFFSKISGWIIPAAIVLFVVLGLVFADKKTVEDGLLGWILLNSTFAALGALISLANPLTIITSFITAPIATLHPFLGVGLFAAVVEAFIRRPRVRDAENLNSDASSLKGVYKNRITHILLIFFVTSLGGAAGNILSVTPLGKVIKDFIITGAKGFINLF